MIRLAKPNTPIMRCGNPLLVDLVGAWLFSERGGTTARNVADRSGDATLASGATWGTSPWGSCLAGAGGTNDYADAGDFAAADLGSSNYTLFLRCRVDAFSGGSSIIMAKDTFSGVGNGLYVEEWAYGTNRLYFWTGSANLFTSSATAKQWYNLAAVRSGTGAGQVQLYLDGAPVGTCTDSRTLSNSHPLRFLAPADATMNRCVGAVDSVLLWRRALSAEEVQAVHRDPYSPWRSSPVVPPLAFEVATTTTHTVSETFTLSDVATLQATLSGTDTFTATDSAADLFTLVVATDTFTSSESAALTATMLATESFAFSESSILDNGTTAPWLVSVVISTPGGWHDPEFTHVSDV